MTWPRRLPRGSGAALLRPGPDTRRRVLGMLACAAAGALFAWLQSPLPWMIGPLVVMAVLRFCGAQLLAPVGSRETGQVIISAALGLYFTAEVGRQVMSHAPLLVALAFFSMALAYLGAFVISRLSATDWTTALFASVPGGASEMANLGERYGAKVDRIAVAQSLRVLMVVIIVPFALALLQVQGTDTSYVAPRVRFDPMGLVGLLGACAAGGIVLGWIRLPNPFMLGPLLVAIGLTVTGVELSAVPSWLTNGGQLLLGCALGQRFDRAFLAAAPRFALVVVVSIALAMAVAALFAVVLAALLPIAGATLIVAAAPGGVAEMCLTAKALKLGVPLVTAAHVTRVVLLVTLTVPVFRLVRATLARMRR